MNCRVRDAEADAAVACRQSWIAWAMSVLKSSAISEHLSTFALTLSKLAWSRSDAVLTFLNVFATLSAMSACPCSQRNAATIWQGSSSIGSQTRQDV
eukprot:1196294-Amphidinium_carterae.1